MTMYLCPICKEFYADDSDFFPSLCCNKKKCIEKFIKS